MLDHAPPFPGDLAEALGFPPAGDRQWDAIAGSGADSVEIKILLTPGDDTAALLSGTHAVRVRHRRLHLLDTVDLALARAGVHLRLRDRGRDRWDLTVRLRGSGAVAVPDLPRPTGGRVELDVLPGAVYHSSEVRERVPAGLAIALRDSVLDPRELLTGPQAALLAYGVPDLDGELWAHGPLRVERASVPRPRCRLPHARHERCRFPGGRVLEEFSARCLPAQAPEVARASAYLLAAHRLTAAASQRTKTAVWADELLAGVR
ncbi:hypothetical protein Acsp06_39030 [Actinomycetospora sp. NBRC 106375]|uniref:hypothetical protein n=1 Tax=Actinomycetospora sp. NBRC 106375 TaxID=3032207 RepID=UPI0024A1EA35|nr:hypothetical protein [Actinomycetospora sp. NBRC 106375]GLZ47718.1 hypothetical protein Acsp06_39030 [Actinomycetospora sp. NBRC 106375]